MATTPMLKIEISPDTYALLRAALPHLPPPISGGAMLIPLIPLFLPAIPGLVSEIINLVEAWTAKPGTTQEQKVALARMVSDLKDEAIRVKAQLLPGDEPPAGMR